MEYKFCPLCATPLAYRHVFGRERQQCPNCRWVHFIELKVGTGVMAEQEGKVLLVRRGINPGKGMWCFPSGFVEHDETPQAAAAREYKEETGLEVTITGLMDVYYHNSDFRGAGIMILYRGQIVGGSPAPMDDVTEIGLFGPDEVPQEAIAFRSNQIALAEWARGKRQASKA